MIEYCVINEYNRVSARYTNFNSAYNFAVEKAIEYEGIVTIVKSVDCKRLGYWLINERGNICGFCSHGDWSLTLIRSYGFQNKYNLSFADLHDIINSTAFICDFYGEKEVSLTLRHGVETYQATINIDGLHLLNIDNYRHFW